MRPALYTDDDIRAAAHHLRADNRKVTAFSVREELGGGNYARIQAVLHDLAYDWSKAAPAAPPPKTQAAVQTFRERLNAGLDMMTTTLLSEAAQRWAEKEAAYQQEPEAMRAAQEQEGEQAFALLDRRKKELAEANARVETHAQERDAAVRGEEEARAEARGAASAMNAALAAREQELKDVRIEMVRLAGAVEAERALRLAAEDRIEKLEASLRLTQPQRARKPKGKSQNGLADAKAEPDVDRQSKAASKKALP